MDFEMSEIVHVPRAEEYGESYAGRDVLYTPEGEYIGDVKVVPFDDSPQLEVNFQVAFKDDLEELLEDYEVINKGETEEPHFNEKVLGKIEDYDIRSFRTNNWVQLEGDGYRVHLENVESDMPSIMSIYRGREIRNIAADAAGYAEDFASIDIEEVPISDQGETYTEQDLWEDLFIKSFSNAMDKLEKIEKKT